MTDSLTDDLAPPPATVLCVDDEPNILSALRRLFRPEGYRVLVAESGAAGLAILEQEKVDLVISDMRMPEMDGAKFLEHVRQRWPDTVRLLLTGYSDVSSILAAINRGEIYRYITKPWDDNDILLVVRHGLERHALEREKARLEALTLRQNDELKTLNQSLEAKVEIRTEELRSSRDTILETNKKLKGNFITTIKILSSMIEMRGGNLAGHSRRVADLARRIAVKLGLDANATQEVFIAALLHDIGKIGFPDDLLAMPVNLLAGDMLGVFRKHPLRAEQLLMPLDDLRGVAALLRAHMERFDGGGFPDGIAGPLIPLGARILALASDYDNLQIGALLQRKVLAPDAKQIIYDAVGKRYDPKVVAAFRALMDGEPVEKLRDLATVAKYLTPGMTLSRDLVTPDGVMLLSADHVLDERLIQQVQDFEAKNEVRLNIWVWPAPPKGD
ncbi:two-component system response regulator [Massilia violaceinigra]|uniref:Two-component system response regulator n=1 Tax=Massilia violaceinigra TaxID=2045208 RepID=A0A2D2DT79_9BURK|nr:HD domain-containing phosphohydrolase [Massilia violaceinigra]ATQ78189.1 two-component system response regulator [Massilia violaceinigra]